MQFKVCTFDSAISEKGNVKLTWRDYLSTDDIASAKMFARALSLRSNFTYFVVTSQDGYNTFEVAYSKGEII